MNKIKTVELLLLLIYCMAVRNTEKKIPEVTGIASAADLGQTAAAAGNANVILVSYLSSPLAVRRLQNYVVFVINNDAAGANVNSYDWIFTNGAATNLTTSVGVAEFTPQNAGTLTVEVRLKNNANATIATVTLNQQVVALNAALETRIDADERAFPGAGHPETSRELLNDLRLYINAQLPVAANDRFNKLLCSLAYARALETPAFRRNIFIEDFAKILHTNPAGFFAAARGGFGVCRTRPQLLAMLIRKQGAANAYINPVVERRSRVNRAQQTAHDTAVQNAFNLLTPDDMIDIFNVLRFPKSHFLMTQKIFEELKTRYIPANNIAQNLAVANDTRRLLSEYEQGLIALPITNSPFSGRVQPLMSNPIWAIPVAALAGGGGGAGAPPPPVLPAQVGAPEILPSHTFIAVASPNDNGFLRGANVYHESYALNPQPAISFQEIVHSLSGLAGPVPRLRIVSHFALGAAGGSQVFIPFFTDHRDPAGDEIRFTNWWYFRYAVSDEEGLRAFFENESLPRRRAGFLSDMAIQNNPANAAATAAVHRVAYLILRAAADASLIPFRIHNRNPANATLTLVRWCADLLVLNNTILQAQGVFPNVALAPLPPTVVTQFRTFILARIDAMKTPAGVFVAANVDALRDAIVALTPNTFPVPLASFGTMTFTLGGAFLENHDALRLDLATLRNHLNGRFVDIRGCRVGQDPIYMREARTFFGNAGQEPALSGPDWFQSFPRLGFVEPSDEASVDNTIRGGVNFNIAGGNVRITTADFQREYSAWSGRIGINSQLSFWTNLFNDEFLFLTLSWRNQLPPIGMHAIRLDGLAALAYPDIVPRVKEIFFIPAATGPNAAALTNFNNTMMPHVTTLHNIVSAPDLLTQQAAIQNLANALGQVLPPAPNPVTIQYLQTCVDQLKQFLVAQSGITPLITDLKAKVAHANAGIRYMMATGLPLIVQRNGRESLIILMYLDSLTTDARKSYMRINWENPLAAPALAAINALNPVGNPVIDDRGTPNNHNDDLYNDPARALQASELTNNHQSTLVAINPTHEFFSHVIKIP